MNSAAPQQSDTALHGHAPALSVIVPTFNERANIQALVEAVRVALPDIAWEMIFVDDDSADGTHEEIVRLARAEPRIRCLRRIGRRGLSSAVIEGALVANADVIAVMDADFQHDETKLATMFHLLADEGADLVVGTRYAEGGGIGEWGAARARMSDVASRISRRLVGNQTTDPVSGFFMIRRGAFLASIYNLSQQGYKILIDIIMSSPQKLHVAEVPYIFRTRREGESKISIMVLAEFAFLIIDKATRGWIPPRFVLFVGVGGVGLLVHLCVLYLSAAGGLGFLAAQTIATVIAMAFNYVINNNFTYRDRRLTGVRAVTGLILFMMICSIGAIANVGIADLAIQQTHSWTFAGIAGALIGAVFNFGAASSLVWGRRRRGVVQASEVIPG